MGVKREEQNEETVLPTDRLICIWVNRGWYGIGQLMRPITDAIIRYV